MLELNSYRVKNFHTAGFTGDMNSPHAQYLTHWNKNFMTLFLRLALVVLLVLSTGCAVTPSHAPQFTPAQAPPEGYAIVYAYRLGAQPSNSTIKVSIAGKPIADLLENGYAWAHIRAGTHTLYAKWPDAISPFAKKPWADVTTTHEFEAGKAYYFRLVGDIKFNAGGLLFGNSISTQSGVLLQPANVGLAELTACCRRIQSENERIN
jgi:hypothetical protein